MKLRSLNYQQDDLVLKDLTNQEVIVLTAIGNPQSFIRQLNNLQAVIKGKMIFADHHQFTFQDCQQLIKKTQALAVKRVIVTEKDAVKLDREKLKLLRKNDIKIYSLPVELKFFEEKPLRKLLSLSN